MFLNKLYDINKISILNNFYEGVENEKSIIHM